MNLEPASHEFCLRAISKIVVVGDDDPFVVRVLLDLDIILNISEYNLNEAVVIRDFLRR
jgi:hypothetical protein